MEHTRRCRHLFFRVALFAALLCAALIGLSAGAQPVGFDEVTVFSGLTQPTLARFAPDGRVFVGEKSGVIKVFDSVSDATPTVFADLSGQVWNYHDHGFLGLAVDPGFPDRPYIYVLYSLRGKPGGRLSRLVADPATNTMVGGEQTIIESWCQVFPSHSIGDLQFGPEGALYVCAGDGASYSHVDYGQLEPNNPDGASGQVDCGDPFREGGALRSQDLETADDPVGFSGTMLRIDPDTGEAWPGNPLAGGDPADDRIIAYGLRNPFRFTIDPRTSDLWIGDVGWGTWEEINVIPGATIESDVLNFGWPCYEGAARQGGYDGANLPICENLYSEGAADAPYYAYRHYGSASISGVTVYTGERYPDAYDGAVFFGDYAEGRIRVMYADGNGVPDPQTIDTFRSNVRVVDMQQGPDGNLYYVEISSGEVRRFEDPNAPEPEPRYLATEVVATGFDRPVFVTAPPGDTTRLFVPEQTSGLIWVIDDGSVLQQPFLDLGNKIGTEHSIQGLTGLAFHPDYASNGHFFVNYTDLNGDTVVERYTVSGNPNVADPNSGVIALGPVAQPSPVHNGAMLAFDADGFLYVGMGDGGPQEDPGNNSQNLDLLHGKILRLDVDNGLPAAPAPGNPWIAQGGNRSLLWAYGLRNPFRFSFDRETDDLWIGDPGQDAWEEVNFEPADSTGGRNYGWRLMEATHPFGCPDGMTPAQCDAARAATVLPIHEFPHDDFGHAVTGGYVYRGDAMPGLRGTYFFGDFVQGRVWSFRYRDGQKVNFTERTDNLARDENGIGNIVSFGEDAAGEIYIVDYQGRILRIIEGTEPGDGGGEDPDPVLDIPGDYTMVIEPVQDATLYEDTNGALANGSGEFLFSGATGGLDARRALLKFDVAAALPEDAIITHVTLRLNCSRKPVGVTGAPFYVHRANASWGEGASVTTGPGGAGVAAQANDATWMHRFYDTETWATPGGDFDGSVRAEEDVDEPRHYHWTSQELIDDVQAWIADPAVNHGWMILGDETRLQSARRFDSREHSDPERRPQLGIGYSLPPAETARVNDGLGALYTFEEASGSVVRDVSGASPPIDLTIANPGNVTWSTGALRVDTPTLIGSDAPATRLSTAIANSNALTLEAWVQPDNTTQDGPARVLSISENTRLRNATLGQKASAWEVRLRASSTNTNGWPPVTSPSGLVTTNLQHVVYTRDATGAAVIYLDGTPVASGAVGGDTASWDTDYYLGLANELDGSRPWLGLLHLAAVYTRALSPEEVTQNFEAGPDGNIVRPDPPVIETFTANPDQIDAGGSSILTWNVTDATSVEITPEVGAVDAFGTTEVSPTATTTYTLSAGGPGGMESAQVTVTVRQPLPPVIDSFTATPVPRTAPVRVMPLGDSLTQADSNHASYRRALWQGLQTDGLNVDFVGSLTNNNGGANPYQDFDLDHEGHWGWTTAQLLSSAPGWFAAAQPDIILLQAGTNDANQDVSVALTESRIGEIIDAARAENPGVAILLSLIPPVTEARTTNGGNSLRENIAAINAILPGLAATKTTAASPVLIVDAPSALNPDVDTYDGVHLTESGEAAYAARWREALAPLVIQRGGTTAHTLAWATTNADTVGIAPGIGSVDLTGDTEVTPEETTTYTLTATNTDGSDTRDVTVNVDGVVPVINAFSAAPDEVIPGEDTTLTWNVSGAQQLYLYPEVGEVTGGGSAILLPSEDTTYTLVALSTAGIATATVDVTVTEAPPEAPTILVQPVDRNVSEGQRATFSIVADGDAPLAYQWRRDGTDLPGANGASYTTAEVTVEDDGARFDCVVSNVAGTVTSSAATLRVNTGGARVTDGLQALYHFEEGQGEEVFDVSGIGAPLNLTVQDLGDTTWVAGGIAVTGATRIVSGAPATKIIDAVKASGAISVEAWITPANLTQTGPARIVSISSNTRLRNVTLGQARNYYETRLRTTETSNNGIPAVTTGGGTAQTVLQHILYTRDNAGAVAMYIDGQEVATGSVGGSFDNWDDAYRLILANEYDGSRPWNGTLHLAAVYAKALDALEVQQNFVAGPDGDQTVPEVTIDAFTVAPEAIILGQSAQLAWQTNGATEVAITPDIGIVAASGTRSVSPVAATTYTLTATGPGGSASATASVAVSVPDPPVIDSFTASPTTIDPGDSATLTWSVTGAEEVSIAPGFASLPASGTVSVSPSTSTTFTLTADNAGGSVSQAALITVEAPPEAPVITLNPADVRLLAGETATFTVEATGTAPLAFQWQRDGVDIAGATASAYTTDALAAADDGARYRCVVSNAAGSATSEEAVLTVIEPGDRVTDDLQALYLFAEGAGDTVYDVSGVGDPLNLTIADTGRVTWTDDGLALNDNTIVQSAAPATKIIDAVRASNAITVEAWVATADLNQDGPARVVSISRNTGQRNVTLGQKGGAWETRLRTTTTSNNGWPPVTTANGNVTTTLQHVVYTRDANGLATTHINGVEVVMDNVGGDMLNWDETYHLGLGNELNQQRPWRGELALVAVYSKALSGAEVDQNFNAFAGGNAPAFEPVAGNAAHFNTTTDTVHTADQDGDGVMGLNEILRVVQLYNGGGIACGLQTEDGYAIGEPGEAPECPPHAADVSPTDWQIQLGELLRIIQIFNQGGYESCARPTSEDGYCAE